MLIDDLNSDNTFVVIQPDEDDPAWFASVAVLDEGGYEVVRRDTTRREHDVTAETSIDRMPECSVTWTIEIGADPPVHAAYEALAVQRDPTSWAAVSPSTRTTVTWSSTSTPISRARRP